MTPASTRSSARTAPPAAAPPAAGRPRAPRRGLQPKPSRRAGNLAALAAGVGAGLTIAYGAVHTPFGEALALTTPRGLCGFTFVGPDGRDAALADMVARWPAARFVEDAATVEKVARPIFAERREPGATLTLALHGTPWQLKVWEALLRIPPGALVSYEGLAAALGAPKAARAVGTAVGANPIGYVIPCHRVIRKTGAISAYRWGHARKRALIGWEAARHEGASLPAQPCEAPRP